MPTPTRITSTLAILAIAFGVFLTLIGCSPHEQDATSKDQISVGSDTLPPEAVATLELILRGGPFPYRNDGVTFHNRENRFPARPRGYYREYTVPTPGARDRGARRIVSGGDPPEVFYYTADHYRSFRPISPGNILPEQRGPKR